MGTPRTIPRPRSVRTPQAIGKSPFALQDRSLIWEQPNCRRMRRAVVVPRLHLLHRLLQPRPRVPSKMALITMGMTFQTSPSILRPRVAITAPLSRIARYGLMPMECAMPKPRLDQTSEAMRLLSPAKFRTGPQKEQPKLLRTKMSHRATQRPAALYGSVWPRLLHLSCCSL
jgi:hypothetical protein